MLRHWLYDAPIDYIMGHSSLLALYKPIFVSMRGLQGKDSGNEICDANHSVPLTFSRKSFNEGNNFV